LADVTEHVSRASLLEKNANLPVLPPIARLISIQVYSRFTGLTVAFAQVVSTRHIGDDHDVERIHGSRRKFDCQNAGWAYLQLSQPRALPGANGPGLIAGVN
jgi:hypothetical protein